MADLYVYAAAGALVAFGAGWFAGYGPFALVFAPVGAVLAILDVLFDLLYWWPWR